jgi:hypothetical protein
MPYCEICECEDAPTHDDVCAKCWEAHRLEMLEGVGAVDGAGVEVERCEAALAVLRPRRRIIPGTKRLV